MSNREFNELIEKVYEQKFNNKSYTKNLIEEIKAIPSFYYDELENKVRIELKADELSNNFSDLSKFYNELQNLNTNKNKELTIEIDCDEFIYKKILNKYIDIIHFVNKPNTKYYTKKYFKEKILVELQALEDIIEYSIKNNLRIRINKKEAGLCNENLKLNFKLEFIEEHYYLTLKQNINKFYHIIQTNHFIYIFIC